jgi:hypothetical protein
LSLDQKLVIFNIMEKQEAIKQLANGTGVTLFCTPQGMQFVIMLFFSVFALGFRCQFSLLVFALGFRSQFSLSVFTLGFRYLVSKL